MRTVIKTTILLGVILLACNGLGGCVEGDGAGLVVADIGGPKDVDEYTTVQYSISVTGGTNVTYKWTVDPPTAGKFSTPTSSITDFRFAGVHSDSPITITAIIESGGSEPIIMPFPVNVKDKITTAPNLKEVDFLPMSLAGVAGDQYTFNYTGSPPDIEAGDMIVSSVGDGFLFLVDEIQDTGSAFVIKTSPASIEDAMVEGRLTAIIDFSGNHEGLALRTANDDDGITFYSEQIPIFYDFSDVMLYKDEYLELKFDTGSEFDMQTVLKVEYVAKDWEPAYYQIAALDGSLNLTIKLKAEFFASYQYGLDVPIPLPLPSIVFELGPFKCTLGLILRAGCDFTLGGGGTFKTGYYYDQSGIDFGVKLYPNIIPSLPPTVETICDLGVVEHGPLETTADLDADMEMRVFLRPEFGVDFTGGGLAALKLMVDYEPYIKLTAEGEYNSPDDWCIECDLFCGQSSDLTIQGEIFGVPVVDWIYPIIEEEQYTLCDPCLEVGPCGDQTNQPPTATAHADKTNIQVGEWVQFYDDSTDPDGLSDIVKWEWDFSYDGVNFNSESVEKEPSHQFNDEGTFDVQLRVTDSVDHQDMLDTPITVMVAPPQDDNPPTAVAIINTPAPLYVAQPLEFDGSDSYDNDEGGEAIVKWEWDWNNDGIYDSQGMIANNSWPDEDTYFIQLRVTDDEGTTDVLDEPLEVIVQGYPPDPVEINYVDLPDTPAEVVVSGGYAFVADAMSGLQIVDIEPALSAHIVKEVEIPGGAMRIAVSGGYAYVAEYSYGFGSELYIVDIEPVSEAQIVGSVSTISNTRGIAVSGGYAYTATLWCGLHIIDIEPVSEAQIVNTVAVPDIAGITWAMDVVVSGGYAYVAIRVNNDGYGLGSGLQIIDVDPISLAHPVTYEWAGYDPWGVAISNGYAYTADRTGRLNIIDINPVSSASLVRVVFLPDEAWEVAVLDGYAYVANGDSGLQIVDIEPYSKAHIVSSVNNYYTLGVAVSGNYAYVTDGSGTGGLGIIQLW